MDTQSDLTYSEHTGIELLYRGRALDNIAFTSDVVRAFNEHCEYLDVVPVTGSIDYDREFLIPDHYRNLDVMEYIAALVPDHQGRQERVAQELMLYQSRNLFPVLRVLIYIVDQMRKHGIVWGVGRGSSVSSYCLYLIGIHRIDSYKYDLPIQEFLK